MLLLAREGPDLVEKLLIEELGVPFDRDGAGFHWTLEGAHSVPRVLHVKDETGAPIERALLDACGREKNIRWRVETTAVDLLTLSHDSVDPTDRYHPPAVIGAHLLSRAERRASRRTLARETILATGGLGPGLPAHDEPPGARGDGIAMAQRAGARLLNLEYIQFHPTALVHPKGRLLLTEALRGEGARITDASGKEFLRDVHPDGELAPRDVVARAIHQRMLEKDEPHALLDISHKDPAWIRERFPGLAQRCRELGFDLTAGPVPVVPAAHYSCGGVAVDGNGRTTPRASARRRRGLLHGRARREPPGLDVAARGAALGVAGGKGGGASGRADARGRLVPGVREWQPEHEPVDPALIAQDWMVIRHTMWNYVGLLRSERRLDRAGRILGELRDEIEDFYRRGTMSDALLGLRNGVQTALAIHRAAADNRVSRGSHYRVDSPSA